MVVLRFCISKNVPPDDADTADPRATFWIPVLAATGLSVKFGKQIISFGELSVKGHRDFRINKALDIHQVTPGATNLLIH